VLVASLPSSLVGSLNGLLWPVLAIGGLGLVLVVAGGVLLGNYISAPISELEDGLLAIINGQSDLRFQLEHPELGGLVFRINSLLNAMAGVAEDTTDDQGRPSQGPSAQGFQDPVARKWRRDASSTIKPGTSRAPRYTVPAPPASTTGGASTWVSSIFWARRSRASASLARIVKCCASSAS
jgi:hypothetical protein